MLFRNVAMFSSGNGVHKEFKKAWPVSDKKESTRIVVDDEMKAVIKKLHGIKL